MLKNTIKLLLAITFSYSVVAQAPPVNTNNGSAGQSSPSFGLEQEIVERVIIYLEHNTTVPFILLQEMDSP